MYNDYYRTRDRYRGTSHDLTIVHLIPLVRSPLTQLQYLPTTVDRTATTEKTIDRTIVTTQPITHVSISTYVTSFTSLITSYITSYVTGKLINLDKPILTDRDSIGNNNHILCASYYYHGCDVHPNRSLYHGPERAVYRNPDRPLHNGSECSVHRYICSTRTNNPSVHYSLHLYFIHHHHVNSGYYNRWNS
jgi:hypothetical protein